MEHFVPPKRGVNQAMMLLTISVKHPLSTVGRQGISASLDLQIKAKNRDTWIKSGFVREVTEPSAPASKRTETFIARMGRRPACVSCVTSLKENV